MDMKQASELVLAKYSDHHAQINPAILAVIIEMIQVLLPLVLEQCNKKSTEAIKMADQAAVPETFQGRMWRWAARRHCMRAIGREDYLEAGGDDLLTSVLLTATCLQPGEMDSLFGSLNPYRGV